MRMNLRIGLALAVLASACGGDPGNRVAEPEGRLSIPFPYPFTTPTPPQEATPLDGTYVREIGPDVAGPVGKCTRCPPYRLELGDRNTLVLQDGVFRVRHDATTWESAGHYLVDGGRVTFFNDPNCPTVRGVYRWREAGGALSLATVDDDCAFDGLRERYLTATAWSREPTGA